MAKIKEGTGNGKFVGYVPAQIQVVNPTVQQKKEVLGFEQDPNKEIKGYTGINSNSNAKYLMLQFWFSIKSPEVSPKYKDSFTIFLSDEQDSMGSPENGLLGWIDDDGNISYAQSPAEAEEKTSERGYKFSAKTARKLYKGESVMMSLYKAIQGKGSALVLDENDINILLNDAEESNVLLNTWFISKGKDGKINKTVGILLGMDEKGNTKLYDKAFGTLDWIKKKLEKNNYFKAQFPSDFALTSWTKDDLVGDDVDEFFEEADTVNEDQF